MTPLAPPDVPGPPNFPTSSRSAAPRSRAPHAPSLRHTPPPATPIPPSTDCTTVAHTSLPYGFSTLINLLPSGTSSRRIRLPPSKITFYRPAPPGRDANPFGVVRTGLTAYWFRPPPLAPSAYTSEGRTGSYLPINLGPHTDHRPTSNPGIHSSGSTAAIVPHPSVIGLYVSGSVTPRRNMCIKARWL